MSHATAKTHVSRLLTKLDARDRAQLVMLAYESGVIVPGGQADASGPQVPGWPGMIIPTLIAPSTIRSAPLTNPLSSEARKSAASATSSIRPRRWSGDECGSRLPGRAGAPPR